MVAATLDTFGSVDILLNSAGINTVASSAWSIDGTGDFNADARTTSGDLVAALARNNLSTGAGYIERRGGQYLIRSPGQLGGLDDIRSITVALRDDVPCVANPLGVKGAGEAGAVGAPPWACAS